MEAHGNVRCEGQEASRALSGHSRRLTFILSAMGSLWKAAEGQGLACKEYTVHSKQEGEQSGEGTLKMLGVL